MMNTIKGAVLGMGVMVAGICLMAILAWFAGAFGYPAVAVAILIGFGAVGGAIVGSAW